MQNVTTFVFYSFETTILNEFSNSNFIKLFCGNSTQISLQFRSCINYFDVDCENNVSDLNIYINEMTGMFWISKNLEKFKGTKYISTAHYRRYMKFDEAELLSNTIICEIMPLPSTVLNMYNVYHVIADLIEFKKEFDIECPEYKLEFEMYLNSCSHAVRNVFVMSYENFMKYGKFIEKCISICLSIKDKLELDKRDKYQIRALSFILERMTGFWIFYMMLHENISIINRKVTEIDMASPYLRT